MSMCSYQATRQCTAWFSPQDCKMSIPPSVFSPYFEGGNPGVFGTANYSGQDVLPSYHQHHARRRKSASKSASRPRSRSRPRARSRSRVIASVGSKADVYAGLAKHTSGGLTRKDLKLNRRGKVVSKKQYAAGKRAARLYLGIH